MIINVIGIAIVLAAENSIKKVFLILLEHIEVFVLNQTYFFALLHAVWQQLQ